MREDKRLQLAGVVVSEGTMRSEDLIPKFIEVLQANGDSYNILPEIWDDPTHPFWGSEDSFECVGDLFERLNDIAPDGHFFGAHIGDGACFGFWRHEEIDG